MNIPLELPDVTETTGGNKGAGKSMGRAPDETTGEASRKLQREI